MAALLPLGGERPALFWARSSVVTRRNPPNGGKQAGPPKCIAFGGERHSDLRVTQTEIMGT